MSTTETSPVAPEVRLFLARVRHELVDLDPDEVTEMTDGLEADLTELVADRGPSALGSPAEYAEELRAAAGLEVRSPGRPGRRPVGESVDGLLDAVRHRADGVLARLPRDTRPLLTWLRPLWWVARAWAAIQLGAATFSAMTGVGYYFFEGGRIEPLPAMSAWSWALLAAAVVISVQVGRGRLWPGGRRGAAARVVLLVLNGVAIVAVPYLVVLMASADSGYDRGQDIGYDAGYHAGYRDGQSGGPDDQSGIFDQAGVYSDGHWVSNIYAYDASGKPLTGVQLFDQMGKPISVVRGPECPDGGPANSVVPQGWSVVAGADVDSTCSDYTALESDARVSYPWTNGAAQVGNVYPLATRLQESFLPQVDAFASSTPPTIGPFPLASVPPVSLPGITPSVQRPAATPDGATKGR
ncbi:hypothetical protein SAMN04487968_103300 [Nocardioides terrae]|uniref:Uncharacterized protein n=1 Tax=Nocardioides terrae TaxID=574651 RepID=A0A1I1G8F7_9ACTN|nr:hypothetical protein [Nocardioides terrae]SFC07977.1 hypothetical protein SAMN04487968_103300 [Nocardioides terrae]